MDKFLWFNVLGRNLGGRTGASKSCNALPQGTGVAVLVGRASLAIPISCNIILPARSCNLFAVLGVHPGRALARPVSHFTGEPLLLWGSRRGLHGRCRRAGGTGCWPMHRLGRVRKEDVGWGGDRFEGALKLRR